MLLSVLAAGSSFGILAAGGSHTSTRIDAQILARDGRLAVRYSPLQVECSAAVQL